MRGVWWESGGVPVPVDGREGAGPSPTSNPWGKRKGEREVGCAKGGSVVSVGACMVVSSVSVGRGPR